jgi:hypothetical protein
MRINRKNSLQELHQNRIGNSALNQSADLTRKGKTAVPTSTSSPKQRHCLSTVETPSTSSGKKAKGRKKHSISKPPQKALPRCSAPGITQPIKSIKIQRASAGYWVHVEYGCHTPEIPQKHKRFRGLFDGLLRTINRHCDDRNRVKTSTVGSDQ